VFAPDQTVPDFALPAVDVRALARRAAPVALMAAGVVAVLVLEGGRLHAFTDAVRHGLEVNGGWVAVGVVFETLSLAGYVVLMSLVVGRATPRIGARESAQITLAGAAATRLLPTAGAGGAAMTLFALRRAGLGPLVAARTLLVFLVALYSVFLVSLVLSGAALAAGLVGGHGPTALSAIPAAASLLVLALSLLVAFGGRARSRVQPARGVDDRDRRSRLRSAAQLFGEAVRDASRLPRSGDLRLVGAVAYWVFDAAVLWAMLHAFGASPAIPAVALAYLLGQVANTLPVPGSVSGGIAGVLIALGVHAEIAVPSVLAYRTLAVWLPTPVAAATMPGLRSTLARWGRETAPSRALTS
jgi:uncharacterized membrane protein YbhN (UPF0104 family)